MDTHVTTTGQSSGLLGLGEVLVGSLPAALLTESAPDRYTVAAVFSRKPDRDEVEEILGSDTRSYLSRQGYPTVEVTVSDRRLEIANTNLEELRDGLAGVLAERLADISADVQARRGFAAARFEEASHREQQRAAAVAALAESVSFVRRVGAGAAPGATRRQNTPEDRSGASDWIGEGGAARR
ncbi:hypothetical protein [Microbacterium sp. 18062]|uniref:hypothetical protein n=1 Tax=Microbacterium sp. 18062 TaxID=2681410 RepID=UPI00135CA597|nr:hypothetical protein [Microbacterium sp. 18062]